MGRKRKRLLSQGGVPVAALPSELHQPLSVPFGASSARLTQLDGICAISRRERGEQRSEAVPILAPPSDRGLVDRLPDLHGACGADRAFVAVKLKAARIPGETAAADDP